jgi:Rieske Fe-S protein
MSEQSKNHGCAGCSRRSFLVASGAAVVASAALPGCGGPASLEGEVRVALADHPALAADGGLSTIKSSDSGFEFDIFVRRKGDGYIAMSAECTHSSCPVAARASDLYCNCHGSRFNLDGGVLQGPASDPLNRFNVAVEGEELVITA